MNKAIVLIISLLLTLGWSAKVVGDGSKQPTVALGSNRPLVAIWCQDQGFTHGEFPYLRIAVWKDGRVLFATDPKKWSHSLHLGRISAKRVAELKKRIAETGVFDLKDNSNLVPDGGVDCMMVNLGDRKQMLYWDEVEAPNYGGNYSPTPMYLKFKECWKAINRLVLVIRPKDAKSIEGRFGRVPRSWYLDLPPN